MSFFCPIHQIVIFVQWSFLFLPTLLKEKNYKKKIKTIFFLILSFSFNRPHQQKKKKGKR